MSKKEEKRTRVIIELEWNKNFDMMKLRDSIRQTLDKEFDGSSLTAYSIYEKP